MEKEKTIRITVESEKSITIYEGAALEEWYNIQMECVPTLVRRTFYKEFPGRNISKKSGNRMMFFAVFLTHAIACAIGAITIYQLFHP